VYDTPSPPSHGDDYRGRGFTNRPDRNGGRNLSLLHEHLAHDDLVAWGNRQSEATTKGAQH
jgi:hypothetical protein